MLYLLAIFLPWLSLLFAGKPFQAIFSLALDIVAIVAVILFFLFPGFGFALHAALVLHAFLVINSARADKRARELLEAMRGDPRR
jgi:hypothetical protein